MLSTSSTSSLPEAAQSQLDLNVQYHQELALQKDPASLNIPVVQNCVYPVAGYPGQIITGFESIHIQGNFNQQHLPARSKVGEKPKRTRLAYSDLQRQVLSEEFAKNPYINHEQRKQLSITLGIPERNIKVWYQNRRQDRKKLMEADATKKNHTESTSFSDATQRYACPSNGNQYHNFEASEEIPHNAQYLAQIHSGTRFLCEVNEMNVSAAPVDTLATAQPSMNGTFNQFGVYSDQHGISSTSNVACELNGFHLPPQTENIQAYAEPEGNKFCLGDYINLDDATM